MTDLVSPQLRKKIGTSKFRNAWLEFCKVYVTSFSLRSKLFYEFALGPHWEPYSRQWMKLSFERFRESLLVQVLETPDLEKSKNKVIKTKPFALFVAEHQVLLSELPEILIKVSSC